MKLKVKIWHQLLLDLLQLTTLHISTRNAVSSYLDDSKPKTFEHWADIVSITENDKHAGFSYKFNKIGSKTTRQLTWLHRNLWNHQGKTCRLGSNRIVIVCTRKGSIGGSSGFTGRKDENGTLTCHFFRGELWRIHSGLQKIITRNNWENENSTVY